MGQDEFAEQLALCTTFLLRHGFLLTALELRQEVSELHPDAEVPPELDAFLSRAEAGAFSDEEGAGAKAHVAYGNGDALVQVGVEAKDPGTQVAMVTPSTVASKPSVTYLEYKLRIVEEELLVVKEELTAQLRVPIPVAGSFAVPASVAPDSNDGYQESVEPEAASKDSKDSKLHSPRAAADTCVSSVATDVDAAATVIAAADSSPSRSTKLEVLQHKEIAADAEPPESLLQEDDVIDPAVALAMPVVSATVADTIAEVLPAAKGMREGESCVAPDPYSVLAVAREVLDTVVAGAGASNARSVMLLLCRSLPLLIPAVASAQRVLLVPLFVLAMTAGTSCTEAGDACNGAAGNLHPQSALVAHWLRIFGPRPKHLGQRLCIAGVLGMLCLRLPEDRIDEEIIIPLVNADAPLPWLRCLLVDCLSAVCTSAAVAAAAHASVDDRGSMPLPGWPCGAPRIVELAEDADATVRAAAALSVARALPRLCALGSSPLGAAFDVRPVVRILLSTMCDHDLRVLHAGHRLASQILCFQEAPLHWSVHLWTQLLPELAMAVRENSNAGTRASEVQLTLFFEILCIFTRTLSDAVKQVVEPGDTEDSTEGSAVQDTGQTIQTRAAELQWLPPGSDELWIQLTPTAIEEDREAEEWKQLMDSLLTDFPRKVASPSPSSFHSVALHSHVARFCRTCIDDSGGLVRSSVNLEMASLRGSEEVSGASVEVVHTVPGMPLPPPPPPDDMDDSPQGGAPGEQGLPLAGALGRLAGRASDALNTAASQLAANEALAPVGDAWEKQGNRLANWAQNAAQSARQSVGGALANLENRAATRAANVASGSLEDDAVSVAAGPGVVGSAGPAPWAAAAAAAASAAQQAAAAAGSVSEAPLTELLRRIDRVTAHFEPTDGALSTDGAVWTPSAARTAASAATAALVAPLGLLPTPRGGEGGLPAAAPAPVGTPSRPVAVPTLPAPPFQLQGPRRSVQAAIGDYSNKSAAAVCTHAGSLALLAWLCGDLLPFVLGLASEVDWTRPGLEVALKALGHWLWLLSASLGPDFTRCVLVAQLQSVLAACGDSQAEGLDNSDLVVPSVPFTLVCTHTLSQVGSTDLLCSMSLAALRGCATEALGWNLRSETSIHLMQTLWQALGRAGGGTTALMALWPCVHDEEPRMRLAAVVALEALTTCIEVNSRLVQALLTLGGDEDRAVLLRAVAALGELWLVVGGGAPEVNRRLTTYFDRLVERGDPEVLIILVHTFTRAALELPAGSALTTPTGAGDLVEAFVLPHLNCLAFGGALRHQAALQAAVAEALLAAAQRRPPLSLTAVESLVLPALREQARKLPDHAARIREAVFQLQRLSS